MCRKIRCDREFWKVFGFLGELNKATSLRVSLETVDMPSGGNDPIVYLAAAAP